MRGGSDVVGAGESKENEQELRLALAMRGGASMAVWIGGAAAEINRLRGALSGPERDEKQQPGVAHPWAALAKLAGYDSVSVDVLAGASAGGLNATLLSASIVYGMPFDRMRRMWIRLADAEALARPVPKVWHSRPESLLEGDAYFRTELARAIVDNVPPDAERAPGGRAELLLTATLLDPVVDYHFDGRSEPTRQQRRTAAFRFHNEGRPGQPLSDFGDGRDSGAGKDFAATAQRLAHAARTTSAYPFAFEPARVHSSPGGPPHGEPDMFGLFSEVDPDGKPFRVIDGGVLDNIPVEAAMRSIAASESDRPIDRWLLYLNPEPIARPEEQRPSRFALPVASAALRTRLTQESLLADIEALEEHNRSCERTALRRKALFAQVQAVEPADRHATLARQVAAVEPEHAVVRAELDAQAVHRLLTRPAGDDERKLLPPVVGDPLVGWSGPVRSELSRGLARRMGAHAVADPRGVFDDVRGLQSRAQESLGWARDVERWVSSEHAAEIGRCKIALHRLEVFAGVLEGHADRYWIHGARLEPLVERDELDGWVDRVVHRRRRLQHELPSPVRPLLGAVLAELEGGARFQEALAEFAAELLSIVDSSGADAVSEDSRRVDAVAEAIAVLDGVVERISAVVPERGAERARPADFRSDGAGELGYELLERARHPASVLRELTVLAAPLDVGRAPGSRINFRRVVSDVQSPLPFEALRRGEETLCMEDKVRGGDLGNFGAFLSARWRANDWMWGRLDAAASLVGLLTDPARLVRRNAELGPEGLGDALQAIVSRPTSAELGELSEERAKQWRDFLARLWAEHAGDVRAELEVLFRNPDNEQPLAETTKMLTARLQWTIVAGELPVVSAVESGADPEGGAEEPVAEPEALPARVQRYSVGRQRFSDLDEHRRASMATRFGLLSYRAARPSGWGILPILGKLGMTLIKPLLLTVLFAVAAPSRAAGVAFFAVTAVAFTGADDSWYLPPLALYGQGRFGDLPDLYGFTSAGAMLVTGVLLTGLAVWLGWQLVGRGRGAARWIPAVLIALVLLAADFWLFTSGFRLEPVGLGLVAVALTWAATFGYRAAGRVAATLVTAAAFFVTRYLLSAAPVLSHFISPFLSGVGWICTFLLVTAYAHVLLLGTAAVLRPRPRPEHPAAPLEQEPAAA